MKHRIIEEIVKRGWSRSQASWWVKLYFELATNRGAETVKQYATEIINFALA